MKKIVMVAALATCALSTAHAAPTLYGKINLSLDQVDNEDFAGNNVTQLNSNASRIGIKGEEKLTDRLSAVYTAEWEISADGDESDAQTFKKRNLFAGLKFNNFGTLKAGIFDSYLKTIAGNNQDIFNDHTLLDMTSVIYGEERLKNSIGFELDKKLLGGLQFNIMAQQGEDDVTNNSASGQVGKRDGFGDSISTSLSYENKDLGLNLGLAGNFGVAGKYNAYSLSGIYSDAIRVTASYDFSKIGLDGLVLGGLWQTAQPTDDTVTNRPGLEEVAYNITAAYAFPSTPWKIKAEYLSASTSTDNAADRDYDLYGIGVDYNLNKQTRFYGMLGQQKKEWLAQDEKRTVMNVGIDYSF
jgi:predicted porin